METKVVTIRLPKSIYEKLYELASENEELPSETIREILRETLTVTKENSDDDAIVAEEVSGEDVIVAELISEDND